jgi:hypothetical protein
VVEVMHGEDDSMWVTMMMACRHEAHVGQETGGRHDPWWRKRQLAGMHDGEPQWAGRDLVVLVGTVPCRITCVPHADGESYVGPSDARHALGRNRTGEDVKST